ncbi:MAG: glycoside hydrolase family 127 protein, partial [Aristaeellaceae bacterium]
MLTDVSRSPYAKANGIPYQDIRWTGGLYKERFDTCAQVTVSHLQHMFESPDISHVVENFRIAAGEAEGEFAGTVFGDGDFYKWMESAVYTAVRTGNQALLDQLEEYIALFSRAQLPDGYLSTKQIIGERQGNGVSRQGDINDFEVYNMGHMFTSACLYYRLTGRDSFLNVAKKAANYLRDLYDTAARTGEVQTAVCPSHYMGLIEMYRTTGDAEYLRIARLAIQLRDSVKNGMDDNQDSLPLKEHRRIIGHAVRANYLYAGVADLYLEEGDPDYRTVVESVWDHLVTQKMYITGGCGALYNGASPYGNFFHHQLVHQAYGYEYQLPNVTAYNETCASLGGVFWAWRMFLMDPSAKYMDMLERMMLNVNMAGISLDGRRFFYENMLRRAKELPYELVWGQERTEYIMSYCCPPNLARTIAQTAEYAYA